MIIQFVLLLLPFVKANGDFFMYSDCDQPCITANISCLIQEISKIYFTCECIESPIMCELHAKSSVVCLRPGNPAIGGEAIYNDWKRYHNGSLTTTTTDLSTTTHITPTIKPTTQPPSPQVLGTVLELVASIAFITLILVAVPFACKAIRRGLQYETMPGRNSSADVPLQHSSYV